MPDHVMAIVFQPRERTHPPGVGRIPLLDTHQKGESPMIEDVDIVGVGKLRLEKGQAAFDFLIITDGVGADIGIHRLGHDRVPPGMDPSRRRIEPQQQLHRQGQRACEIGGMRGQGGQPPGFKEESPPWFMQTRCLVPSARKSAERLFRILLVAFPTLIVQFGHRQTLRISGPSPILEAAKVFVPHAGAALPSGSQYPLIPRPRLPEEPHPIATHDPRDRLLLVAALA